MVWAFEVIIDSFSPIKLFLGFLTFLSFVWGRGCRSKSSFSYDSYDSYDSYGSYGSFIIIIIIVNDADDNVDAALVPAPMPVHHAPMHLAFQALFGVDAGIILLGVLTLK